MKCGTKVRSLISNNIGTIVMLTKNLQFVMIDFSTDKGICFRWACINNIETINE